MKNILSAAAIFLFMVLLNGCGSGDKTTAPVAAGESEILYQNEWKLTEIQQLPVPGNSKAVISFMQGEINKLSGNTGCNRIGGTFELVGNNIKFSPMAVTKMACLDENANNIEQEFVNALMETTNWSMEEDNLVLKKGDTVVARFNKQNAALAGELILNGTWELNFISGQETAFKELFPGKKPTIKFDLPNEEASGFGGCNGYSCRATVDENNIAFGDALHTMMACDGDGEPVYFETLKRVTNYGIENAILTMYSGDIVVMRFARR